MAAQQVAVELEGLGPQAWPFDDPSGGVIRKRDAPGIGVDPAAAEQLSLSQRYPVPGRSDRSPTPRAMVRLRQGFDLDTGPWTLELVSSDTSTEAMERFNRPPVPATDPG